MRPKKAVSKVKRWFGFHTSNSDNVKIIHLSSLHFKRPDLEYAFTREMNEKANRYNVGVIVSLIIITTIREMVAFLELDTNYQITPDQDTSCNVHSKLFLRLLSIVVLSLYLLLSMMKRPVALQQVILSAVVFMYFALDVTMRHLYDYLPFVQHCNDTPSIMPPHPFNVTLMFGVLASLQLKYFLSNAMILSCLLTLVLSYAAFAPSLLLNGFMVVLTSLCIVGLAASYFSYQRDMMRRQIWFNRYKLKNHPSNGKQATQATENHVNISSHDSHLKCKSAARKSFIATFYDQFLLNDENHELEWSYQNYYKPRSVKIFQTFLIYICISAIVLCTLSWLSYDIPFQLILFLGLFTGAINLVFYIITEVTTLYRNFSCANLQWIIFTYFMVLATCSTMISYCTYDAFATRSLFEAKQVFRPLNETIMTLAIFLGSTMSGIQFSYFALFSMMYGVFYVILSLIFQVILIHFAFNIFLCLTIACLLCRFQEKMVRRYFSTRLNDVKYTTDEIL